MVVVLQERVDAQTIALRLTQVGFMFYYMRVLSIILSYFVGKVPRFPGCCGQ
jgi:hypothetical protein